MTTFDPFTLETPLIAILGHKYQLMQCGAVVVYQSKFPELWNKDNTEYYHTVSETHQSTTNTETTNHTHQQLKDFITINNTTLHVAEMTKDFIVLYPANNKEEMLEKWETARLARNQKYKTLFKAGRGHYDVDRETYEAANAAAAAAAADAAAEDDDDTDSDMPDLVNSDGETVSSDEVSLLVG
jgi:predicted urease superfamily metal-dependent hydrolase